MITLKEFETFVFALNADFYDKLIKFTSTMEDTNDIESANKFLDENINVNAMYSIYGEDESVDPYSMFWHTVGYINQAIDYSMKIQKSLAVPEKDYSVIKDAKYRNSVKQEDRRVENLKKRLRESFKEQRAYDNMIIMFGEMKTTIKNELSIDKEHLQNMDLFLIIRLYFNLETRA